MSVMSSKQLSTTIKTIKRSREKFQVAVQEALISCAFYAMKDGNVEPFNQLLDAVGNATRIKGLTMWAETFAPVIVRDGKFNLNKTAKKSIAVTSEADFAEFEVDMRAGPAWYEIAGEQKVESIFDAPDYLERVIKHLRKHGVDSDVIAAVENAEIIARIHKTHAEDAAEGGDVYEGQIVPAPLQIAA